jgi:hypothetical protein
MPNTSRHAITDSEIKALRPADTVLYDSIVQGLVLRARRSGSKSFYVYYRDKLTRKMVWVRVTDPALGTHDYGKPGHGVTLQMARALAGPILLAAAAGRNVTAERAAALTAEQVAAARTFGALAAEYLERHAKKHKKSWRGDDRIIRTQLGAIATRPVAELRRRELRELLNVIVDRDAPVYANRVLRCVRKILNYGIDQSWLEANPAARLAEQPEAKREHVLSDAELRTVWQWLDAPPAGADASRVRLWPLLAAWCKLRIVTAQRGEEVVGMKWADLELTRPAGPAGKTWSGPIWTITDTKNGRRQRVPLSRLAVGILAELQRASGDPVYVFGGIRSARDRHNVFAGAGVGAFQLRDFRRTAATNLVKLGTSRFTLKRVLNHVDRDVTAVYDVYGYEPEKRAALDAWAARLQQLVKPIRLVRGRARA